MDWEQRYFKGDRVWVRLDDEGNYDLEDDFVPMRYEDDPNVKIYYAHPSNLAESEEEARDSWKHRLEEREATLEERERELDAREKALDERQRALEDWESTLKDQGIDRLEASTVESEGTNRLPDDIQKPDLPGLQGLLKVAMAPPESMTSLEAPTAGEVEVYTDGACAGNPGPCGFGLVLRRGDDYVELSGFLGEGTNNIAELTAIEAALAALEALADRPVRIHTDSRYAIGVLVGGWTAKANQELIERIRERIEDFDDLDMRKVEAHAGKTLNERADDLAKETLP